MVNNGSHDIKIELIIKVLIIDCIKNIFVYVNRLGYIAI